MARRKSTDGNGVDLDSLMDALTNVVAVLVFVLVLVQADVTQKVADFMDNLEPATQADIDQSKALLAELQQDQQQKEELLEEKPASPEEIEAESRSLALLEKDVVLNKELLANIEELKKIEVKARKKRDKEQAETIAIQKEIASLEATIDQTKVYEPIAATKVTIPQSRPMPKRANIYYAIVARDRVHFIDVITPEKKILATLKKNRRELLFERIKQRGADEYIYDQTKIVSYFSQNDPSYTRNQIITIPGNPTSTRIYFQITPDLENGGIPYDELLKKRNAFTEILSKLSSDRQAVLMFRVHPDSFATYLTARALTDRAKTPAGWEINGTPFYRHYLPETKVNKLKESPPRPPSRGPSPPVIGPKLD